MQTPEQERNLASWGIIAGFFLASLGLIVAATFWFVIPGIKSSLQDNNQTSQGTSRPANYPHPPPAPPISVPPGMNLERIIPEPRLIQLNAPGDSVALTAQGLYANSTASHLVDLPLQSLRFLASDESVVKVTPDGLVTALDSGGVEITVSYGPHTTEVPVLVWGPTRPIPPIDPDKLIEISDDGTFVLVNRLLTRLKPGYGALDAEELASLVDGKVIFDFNSFPGYVIEFPAETMSDLEAAVANLAADQRVDAAYPDITMTTTQGPTTDVESLLNLDKTVSYLVAGLGDAWLRLNSHKISYDPVLIVVIDTEFPKHWDKGFLGREFDPSRITAINLGGAEGTSNHGAAVTSILVSNNNQPMVRDVGFSGVVTSVSDFDHQLRFYGVNGAADEKGKSLPSFYHLLNALEHIKQDQRHIDVVNISLEMNCGRRFFWDCGQQDDLASILREMPDVTFVVGAGNDNEDIVQKNIIPASFSIDRGSRKALPNVITVGGTDSSGTIKHPESNYGDAVTIAAPYVVWAVNSVKYSFRDFPGTSFSTPLVSGTVALLKGLRPQLKPEQIRDILVGSGRRLTVTQSNSWCSDQKNPGCRVDRSIRGLDAGGAVQRALLWWYPSLLSTPVPSVQLTPSPKVLPVPKPTPHPQSMRPSPTPTRFPTAVPSPTPRPAATLGPTRTPTPTPAPTSASNPTPAPVLAATVEPIRPSTPEPVSAGWTYLDGVTLPSGSAGNVRLEFGKESVYVVLQSSSPSGTQAVDSIDIVTGERQWRYLTSGNNEVLSAPVIYRVGTDLQGNHLIAAEDIELGHQLWEYPTRGFPRIWRVVDGILYLGYGDEGGLYHMEAVEAASGNFLWRHASHSENRIFLALGGKVYLGTLGEEGRYRIDVVDSKSGGKVFSYHSFPGRRVIDGGEMLLDYFGIVESIVVALNVTDWKNLWKSQANIGVEFAAAAGDVGVFESHPGIYASRAGSGERLWSHSIAGRCLFVDRIVFGVVFVKSNVATPLLGCAFSTLAGVIALDASTGDVLWSYEPDGWVEIQDVRDDAVFVMNQDGRERFLHVLEAATGELLWSHGIAAAGNLAFDAADGIVYLTISGSSEVGGTSVEELHAIRIATGETVWRQAFDLKGLLSDMEVAVYGDAVYLATLGGVLEGEVAGDSEKVRLFAVPR